MDYVDVVFDGPPSHHAPQFIEVEDAAGKSIRFGEWVERADGSWALRIRSGDFPEEARRQELIRDFEDWKAKAGR